MPDAYLEALNPRWLACHYALGHRPQGWEFLIWLPARWREFAESICPEHRCREPRDLILHHGEGIHAEFNDWLRTRYPATIPTTQILVEYADLLG